MIKFLARRKAERRLVGEIADKLIASSGDRSYQLIMGRIVERVMNKKDVSLECKVRRELRLRLGIEPHVDTATRYLEKDRHRS